MTAAHNVVTTPISHMSYTRLEASAPQLLPPDSAGSQVTIADQVYVHAELGPRKGHAGRWRRNPAGLVALQPQALHQWQAFSLHGCMHVREYVLARAAIEVEYRFLTRELYSLKGAEKHTHCNHT